MAKKSRDLTSSQSSGFFQDMFLRAKLVLRLMGDRRVNLLLKLLPVAALIYLVSPIDLIPGVVFPIIGALDDAAVLWIGFTLFVNLCPDDVVQEHMNALQKVIPGTWREKEEQTDNDIIDIESQDAPGGGQK
jgi:uncharacterized membrane protein YkvA (DUF1232 family)